MEFQNRYEIMEEISKAWGIVEDIERASIKLLGEKDPLTEILGFACVHMMNAHQEIKEIAESSMAYRSYRFKAKTRNQVPYGIFTRDIENGNYTITSPAGVSKTWSLPDENDRWAIRKLTHSVEDFVREQDGTPGQIKSARKKLTEFGYHITK